MAFCHLDDGPAADALVDELRPSGRPPSAVACDVSIPDDVDAMAATVHDELHTVDIVVNCAGAGGGSHPFETIGPEEWDRVLDVNLRGTYLVTRAFYTSMQSVGTGRIINIASQLAYKGAAGLVHYCAAKAVVVGLTRALALEAAPHGVLVNAIAPGPVDTWMLRGHSQEWLTRKQASLPLGRLGVPEEIGPTALLLASEAGRYYTGPTLSPSGGDVFL